MLAVSGGIDSMVMADLFLNSSNKRPITLAHCDFHLRGEESDADAAFVGDWAKSRGVPFRRADFDTREYASSLRISVEMAARELRYSWFARLCEEEGFVAVAVAHNANDNAETIILNLLRGTGLKGVCGMRSVSPLPGATNALILRPLLDFTRDEIREYAIGRGLSWREDSSNTDSAYKRNLIRNEIFPLFGKINPSFLETLNADARRFSQVQAIADDYFDSVIGDAAGTGIPRDEHLPGQGAKRRESRGMPVPATDSLYGQGARRRESRGMPVPAADRLYGLDAKRRESPGNPIPEGGLSISVDWLTGTPHWEYVLFRLLEPFGFNEAVTRDLAALIKDGSTFSGRKFRGNGFVALTSRDSIVISPLLGQDSGQEEKSPGIVIQGPGEYSLYGIGFVVESVEVDDPRQPEGITAANLDYPFTVRRWRAGDWMRPLGMKGRRKKLSDMFGDLKLTPLQKEKALVIVDEGSHVLALLGHRIDESVALPGKAVRIRLI